MAKLIGFIINTTINVRPQYLSKFKKKAAFIIIEIHENKRYGAIAKIYERNSFLDRWKEKTTIKQRKNFSESFSKSISKDKPVDTSKWVRPDNESIRNSLIESLFFLQIFKEDYWMSNEQKGRADGLYSILHSHNPKNPQSLTNFAVALGDTYFQTIMAEFKSVEHKRYWNNFNKQFKKRNKNKGHWKDRQKEYKIWSKDVLSKMILKDPKPHRFRNIYKNMFRNSKKGSKTE